MTGTFLHNHFECALCGETRSVEHGAADAVEEALGDDERGVCDDCWSKLPGHVVEWAEGRATGVSDA
jgi:hypothetical protein